MADTKLATLAQHLAERIDELVPGGCREKSLAYTNLEQAILWAERARELTTVETIEGMRWHLYQGGPKAGYSGYVERVGEDAPEGHERIVYWLAADGQVQRPAQPGFPPGGEAPPAGADTDRQRVIERGFE